MPVMCPLPSHLTKNLIINDDSMKNKCKARVKCDCSNDNFNLYYFGNVKTTFFKRQYLQPITDINDSSSLVAVIAKCSKCGKEILLFDNNVHSYDSYFKKKPKIKRELFNLFACQGCKRNIFQIQLEVGVYETKSALKINYINQKSHTHNFFDEIKISLLCLACNKEYKDFLDQVTF